MNLWDFFSKALGFFRWVLTGITCRQVWHASKFGVDLFLIVLVLIELPLGWGVLLVILCLLAEDFITFCWFILLFDVADERGVDSEIDPRASTRRSLSGTEPCCVLGW